MTNLPIGWPAGRVSEPPACGECGQPAHDTVRIAVDYPGPQPRWGWRCERCLALMDREREAVRRG